MPSSAWKERADRKSTRLNSSHTIIPYAVFCLKKKKTKTPTRGRLAPRSDEDDSRTSHRSSPKTPCAAHLPFATANTSHSIFCLFFFFNDTATTEIYTLSLHDALPI